MLVPLTCAGPWSRDCQSESGTGSPAACSMASSRSGAQPRARLHLRSDCHQSTSDSEFHVCVGRSRASRASGSSACSAASASGIVAGSGGEPIQPRLGACPFAQHQQRRNNGAGRPGSARRRDRPQTSHGSYEVRRLQPAAGLSAGIQHPRRPLDLIAAGSRLPPSPRAVRSSGSRAASRPALPPRLAAPVVCPPSADRAEDKVLPPAGRRRQRRVLPADTRSGSEKVPARAIVTVPASRPRRPLAVTVSAGPRAAWRGRAESGSTIFGAAARPPMSASISDR